MSKSSYRNKSGLVGAIAIMLVVVMITVALGFLTSGFKNWNAGTWFKKDETTPAETNENFVFDGDGKAMESGKVHAMPKNMLFSADIAAASAASVMIQATVTPDTLPDKSVDWSVAWVNPSSAWATGKSAADYLAIIPQSDGSTTAEVSCLQAFGEKIKITVRVRVNTGVKAECTVDYALRVTGAEINLSDVANKQKNIPAISSSGNEYLYRSFYNIILLPPGYDQSSVRLDSVPEYSVYTVQDEFTFKYYLTYSQAYIDALTAQGLALKANAANEFEIETMDNAGCFPNSILDISFNLSSTPTGGTDAEKEALFCMYSGKLVAANSALGANGAGTLKVVATGQYSTFTRSVDLKLDLTKLLDLIPEVKLDSNTLVI